MQLKPAIAFLLSVGAVCVAGAAAQADKWQLSNKDIACEWRLADGTLQPTRVEDKINRETLELGGECFRLVLGDGTVLKSSDFKLDAPPKIESLKPEPKSPTLARHFGGKQLTAKFSAPERNLSAEWRVSLRDGSAYARQELKLRASGRDVLVREIVLFDQIIDHAATVGAVDGSPVVAGTFFFGYEHPMAQNKVDGNQVRCGFMRDAVLKDGESLTQSFVMGVTPRGQLRRGFLAYIERERAHPYRPFLHYNSWYDIAWADRKFNETEALDAIAQFRRELVEKRGVRMESFLFDDGWDDNRTLWKFNSGFPDGFTRLAEAAAKLPASIGVWLSPFGGYAEARTQRLASARAEGFETNSSGFSLAGPKYYQRFRQICLEMIRKYGVGQFKFDGLAARANAAGNNLTRDGDAMLQLIADLRAAKPDIYINQTTGTWPSPFWLLYVDSTWRGGGDHSFAGKGSPRQRWITYRDMMTYRDVVRAGPLYPLNSLMLHGVIFAVHAENLGRTDDADFADEVHDFFGTGTQLQEMYITPKLLAQQNWDDLAEAAKWSRANANVLVDTHWIGGDPGKGEVYGWASWSPRKGILVFRNPGDQPAEFMADIKELFELPAGAPRDYQLRSPWKRDCQLPGVELRAGQAHAIKLQPFETLVMETQ